jgi:tRNA modification GTPase
MGAGSSAFSTDDTIVAIATPPGRGALGVVRLSGAAALRVAVGILDQQRPLQPRHATFTRVRGDDEWAGDEVVVTYFSAPHSYTGDDVIEISAHGSPVVLRRIVEAACRAGARLARPGEFTLRAYLNGKRDLIQAEAVRDLIEAVTPLQARVAFDQLRGTLTAQIAALDRALFDLIARLEASLDFPDEGYHFVNETSAAAELETVVEQLRALLVQSRRGRVIREGAEVVLTGRVNVGKSLIFNKLHKSDRAIVADQPGTTRDLLTAQIEIDGLAVSLVDTAGMRGSNDVVEAEGMKRASQARAAAELVLLIFDGSQPLYDEDVRLIDETSRMQRLLVVNKADLPASIDSVPGNLPFITVSARTGQGIDRLRAAIVQALTGGPADRESVAISNTRHVLLMQGALEHLESALDALRRRTPEEFVLSDLQAARSRFDDVVGVRTAEDVIAHIFERFCIGK